MVNRDLRSFDDRNALIERHAIFPSWSSPEPLHNHFQLTSSQEIEHNYLLYLSSELENKLAVKLLHISLQLISLAFIAFHSKHSCCAHGSWVKQRSFRIVYGRDLNDHILGLGVCLGPNKLPIVSWFLYRTIQVEKYWNDTICAFWPELAVDFSSSYPKSWKPMVNWQKE